MDLVEIHDTICEMCGAEYNHEKILIPENATFYWVPHCPECGAKMTTNPVTEFQIELAGSDLDSSNDEYENRRERLHVGLLGTLFLS